MSIFINILLFLHTAGWNSYCSPALECWIPHLVNSLDQKMPPWGLWPHIASSSSSILPYHMYLTLCRIPVRNHVITASSWSAFPGKLKFLLGCKWHALCCRSSTAQNTTVQFIIGLDISTFFYTEKLWRHLEKGTMHRKSTYMKQKREKEIKEQRN